MLLFILPNISRTPNFEDKQPIIEIMPGTSTDVLLTAFGTFLFGSFGKKIISKESTLFIVYQVSSWTSFLEYIYWLIGM